MLKKYIILTIFSLLVLGGKLYALEFSTEFGVGYKSFNYLGENSNSYSVSADSYVPVVGNLNLGLGISADSLTYANESTLFGQLGVAPVEKLSESGNLNTFSIPLYLIANYKYYINDDFSLTLGARAGIIYGSNEYLSYGYTPKRDKRGEISEDLSGKTHVQIATITNNYALGYFLGAGYQNFNIYVTYDLSHVVNKVETSTWYKQELATVSEKDYSSDYYEKVVSKSKAGYVHSVGVKLTYLFDYDSNGQ